MHSSVLHLSSSAQKPNKERAVDEAGPAGPRPSSTRPEASAEPEAQMRGEQETPVSQRGHVRRPVMPGPERMLRNSGLDETEPGTHGRTPRPVWATASTPVLGVSGAECGSCRSTRQNWPQSPQPACRPRGQATSLHRSLASLLLPMLSSRASRETGLPWLLG